MFFSGPLAGPIKPNCGLFSVKMHRDTPVMDYTY